MTKEEFAATDWQRGITVRLTNGKNYPVKKLKRNRRYLLLKSEEYQAYFVADHRIIDCRTSSDSEQ